MLYSVLSTCSTINLIHSLRFDCYYVCYVFSTHKLKLTFLCPEMMHVVLNFYFILIFF